MPVFHENRFEIWCGQIVLEVVTNGKISQFVCFVLLRRASFLPANLTSVCISWTSVKGKPFWQRLYSKCGFLFSKFSLTELVLKRRYVSPFIKLFLQFKGWQDEKCACWKVSLSLKCVCNCKEFFELKGEVLSVKKTAARSDDISQVHFDCAGRNVFAKSTNCKLLVSLKCLTVKRCHQ